MSAALKLSAALEATTQALHESEAAATTRAALAAVGRAVDAVLADPDFADTLEGREVLDWAAGFAEDIKQHQQSHPLALATLWAPRCLDCGEWSPRLKVWEGPEMEWTGDGLVHECPDCGHREARTSQRLAIQAVLYGEHDRCFVLGGNRTGKSEGTAQLTVAVILGRDHADVISWCRENGFDMDRIPERRLPRGAGLGYAVALTSNDSAQYVRPKIERYMPAGTEYRNWGGNGQAVATAPNGATLVCKSVDQGRRAMQGAAARVVWLDEEPDGSDALGIIEELDARLTDFDGYMVFSMTPLKGWTPLLEQHLRKPRPDVLSRNLDALDNPHVPRHSVVKRLARYGERIREARRRGVIAALEGSVHPDFLRDVHVVPAFEVPDEWARFDAIDFGARDPFVHLWAARAPDDVLHVFREHYQKDTRLRDHARTIWAAEGCPDCMPSDFGSDEWRAWLFASSDCETCGGSGRREREPERRWADPEGRDARETLEDEFGIPSETARKDRRASFDALDERMQLDVEGKPHIVIHDCCVNTIREVENLVWNEKRKGEMEVKGDDHAWDCLRYLAFGIVLYDRDHGGLDADDMDDFLKAFGSP